MMHIGDQQIPLQRPVNPQPMCYRVLTSRDIEIPASSEMIIPGKLDPLHCLGNFGITKHHQSPCGKDLS